MSTELNVIEIRGYNYHLRAKIKQTKKKQFNYIAQLTNKYYKKSF